MIDHRRMQRTLLRMQLDAGFARALLAGEPEALRSTQLGTEELRLMRELDPVAIAADPFGRRRTQVLGNAASEYALTVATAERAAALPGLFEGFGSSAELHEALRDQGRLPLAFGAYALRRARAAQQRTLAAFAELELALARLRRGSDAPRALRAGELVLGPRACSLALPAGTLARAERARAALDRDEPLPDFARDPQGSDPERALLLRAPRTSAHRLPEVSVEPLSEAVAALLEFLSRPRDRDARSDFARSRGAAPEELEAFAEALVADGVLARGSPPAR